MGRLYWGKKCGKTPTIEAIGVNYFKGDGDFRSEESIKLLKQADIVVTNPPFSLFREHMTQLIEYDKNFLILGNMNALTYKEIFPLIKESKVWQGVNNGAMTFELPKDTGNKNVCKVDDKLFADFGNIIWYTNLSHQKRNQKMILFREYTPEKYPKYDNYDAINVDKLADIPKDYKGVMGVPITIIEKHNPEQFEIVGQGQGYLYKSINGKGLSQKFVDDYYASGGTGKITEGHPVLGYYKDGKATTPYSRILIKNKLLQEGKQSCP